MLVGAFGSALILAGVFVTDVGAGFPPGAPAGAPEISWHGILHSVGFVLANAGMIAACLVFLRRFAARKQRGWVAVCAGTPAAVLTLVLWPDVDGLSIRLLIATAILFGFLAALAVGLMTSLPPLADEVDQAGDQSS